MTKVNRNARPPRSGGLTRRTLLASAAGALLTSAGGRALGAPPSSTHFELRDIEVAGD
ncbi:MAG: hypothetical protein JRI68_32470, partial [Deltaproteobacteria bacterium]|nr:hypothetical protein [Deltaproteobacteria bacterium]